MDMDAVADVVVDRWIDRMDRSDMKRKSAF